MLISRKSTVFAATAPVFEPLSFDLSVDLRGGLLTFAWAFAGIFLVGERGASLVFCLRCSFNAVSRFLSVAFFCCPFLAFVSADFYLSPLRFFAAFFAVASLGFPML